MKINCIINEGAKNPRFISELLNFTVKNNCLLDSNSNFSRVEGVIDKTDWLHLMTICDAYNKKAVKAFINPRVH